MINYNGFASFEVAKLAKDCGYSEGADNMYSVMMGDFIYDDDPNHLESHKRGDLKVYNFWNHNSTNNINQYEIPRYGQLVDWLYLKHGISAEIKASANGHLDYRIFDIVNGKIVLESKSSKIAFENVIETALNYLKSIL